MPQQLPSQSTTYSAVFPAGGSITQDQPLRATARCDRGSLEHRQETENSCQPPRAINRWRSLCGNFLYASLAAFFKKGASLQHTVASPFCCFIE